MSGAVHTLVVRQADYNLLHDLGIPASADDLLIAALHREVAQSELLAHLEWTVEFIRGFVGDVAQVEAIDAAIAKAKGGD